MKILQGIAAAALLAQPAAAQPAPAPKPLAEAKLAAKLRAAEHWLATQLEQEAVPGASAAIIHDQRVVWAKGFGWANMAGKVPATPRTRYSICSVSKLFTSIAAMQLRDAGRLDLDRPIGDYVDWYNIRDVAVPDGPVTARGIMSHVAGLPREADFPYWSSADFPSLADVKGRLGSQTNLYRAYDHLQYSNLGMTLLGEAVGSVSGQGYHDYVRARLIEPIGLSDTTSELPRSLHGKAFAVGYKARNGRGERDRFPFYATNALAAAAGYASTVTDLGKFASWQFRTLAGGDASVLKPATLREMQRTHWVTPDKNDESWGLGFATFMHDGKSMVGHGGYCPGYRTTLMMRPQDKLAYVVMVNVNDVNPGAYVRTLYDLTAAELREIAKPEPEAAPAQKPATDLAQYEGYYHRPGYDYDTYMVASGKDLLAIGLHEDKPKDGIDRFRHVSGDTFRAVLDDESLGDEVRFERAANGRILRVWRHSNPLERVERALPGRA
jgi:CubicO group peptidase (beta-lactamase class C family)